MRVGLSDSSILFRGLPPLHCQEARIAGHCCGGLIFSHSRLIWSILFILIYFISFLFYSIYFMQILFSNLSWIILYQAILYCDLQYCISPVKGTVLWDGVHWEILMIADRVIHYGGLDHYSPLRVNGTLEQVWQWTLLNLISWKWAIKHVWLEFSL